MSAQALPLGTGARPLPVWDLWLLGTAALLLLIGLVMVGSASMAIADRTSGGPLFYLYRQLAYCGVGIGLGVAVLRVPMALWERLGPYLLVLGVMLIGLVLVPGVGREVNGSVRWLAFGPVNLQPSELMKLFMVIYLAGYLVRREEEVRTLFSGFLKPGLLLGLVGVLLLLEPDFGAVAVLSATVLGMLFLGGVRLWQFALVMLLALGALAAVAISSPYRLERLTTFLDPWADPFNSGFQLTQALIAFGRGEWFGVGLGAGVQKLFYLPEAHTDFLFAVLAEELGLLGALGVLGLFTLLVWRAFAIGSRALRAGRRYSAYLALGLGLWIALQVIISVGVNTGLLPTKGLTLPLMSYGGSSLVTNCIAIALLLRADYELRTAPPETLPARRGKTREEEA
jgi:cell division protein FtsW